MSAEMAPMGAPGTHDGRRRRLLAIDTSTTRIVVASSDAAGHPDGLTTWVAGQRHGETLLPSIGRFLGENNLRKSRISAIVVGTGPGAFTGLRVGLATAKGLAHGLGIPIVGVSSGEALLDATRDAGEGSLERLALLLPAGPHDRIVIRHGEPPALLTAGSEPTLPGDAIVVALDLDGRASADALARGERIRTGLGAALLRLGAARLRTSSGDDLAGLVPEYVTLPRGVPAVPPTLDIAWSRR